VETRPITSEPPRTPLTWRKIFHRGIVFWLLVWLASVCTLQSGRMTMKDGRTVALYLGDGAAGICPDASNLFGLEGFDWKHEKIWSPDSVKLIRNYPEILIAKLGTLGVKRADYETRFSFPIAGFLWFWLAAGLYGEIKLLKHPVAMPEGVPAAIAGSRKRIATLGGAMLALGSTIAVADLMTRRAELANACSRHRLIIEANCDYMGVGNRINWEGFFAEDGDCPAEYRNCPCGEPYILAPVQVPKSKLAAQCPRADHRRYLAGKYGMK
jgi:hypothetical protein